MFVQGRTRSSENGKEQKCQIDGFIVGYHLQGALDKFWIPLTVREFIPSFFSYPLPAAVFYRYSHPSVIDSREKMKSRL